MKDLDTKLLSEMYGDICEHIPRNSSLLSESNSSKSSDLALIREFVSQNLPNSPAINKRAELIIESIKRTNNPMISRIIKQCGDISPAEKVKVIYKFVNL